MLHKTSLFFLLALSLSSCLSTVELYQGLGVRPATVSYLHTAGLTNMEKLDTVSVALPVITDSTFTPRGRLVKTHVHLYPLILINDWKSVHELDIGSNFIREDEPNFIQKSVEAEFNRSTVIFADTSYASRLVLEIQVDTLRAQGRHTHKGFLLFFLFFGFWSYYDLVEPLSAHTSMSYQLKRGTEVVLKGKTTQKLELELFNIKARNKGQLLKYLNTALAEGLSEALRMNIEDITLEVEDYLIF